MFRRSPRAALLLLLAIGVLGATGLMAKSDASNESMTARLVGQLVERFHISEHKLDDEISKKTFEKYLSELDPMKLYFLKSDIDKLEPYRKRLDDMTLEGDTSFAHEVYELHLARLRERIAYAHELIDRDFDFTKEESIVVDPENRTWAKTEAEIRDRWRKRIKHDVLSLMLDDLGDKTADTGDEGPSVAPNGQPIAIPKESEEDAPASLAEIRERLHKRYRNILKTAEQTEDIERLEMYLSSLTHSYDPHSSYMSPLTRENFQISMNLQLEGIGAELRSEDGYVIVNRIVEGGAASADGRLKAGDKIIGVKQGDEEDYTDVVEMKLTSVVQLIRGDAGTVVWLQVKNKAGQVKEYELTRQKVELKDAAVRGKIIDTGKRLGGPSYRIGVINIPSFYRDFQGAQEGDENFRSTSRDVLKVLQSFKEQGGIDAMIIDLRYNGGGALTEAIEVSGLFIEKGPIVQVKGPDGEIESHNDENDSIAYTRPLVVLCNRLSASASEIFAGAIKDYDRGIIVGDTTTHGKGTVQNVMSVPPKPLAFLAPEGNRGALKLTISQFYRINGDSTQVVGVPSDIVLPSMIEHLDLGEEFLENALPFSRVTPAEHDRREGLVSAALLSNLRKRSAARIAASDDFKELQEDIAEFVEKKEDKSVSLNQAERRQEILEAQQASDIQQELAEQATSGGDRPVFPEGYYNSEVLQITADYIRALDGPRTAGTTVPR